MSKKLDSKKIAKEDTPVALQKAADIKAQNPDLNSGATTMTRQPSNQVAINPDKLGMQSQSIQ